jgi:hypothetical protein
LTTDPVLKLWLRFENRSGSYAFSPFDSGLMSHRTPRFSADDSTIVNSMLNISSPATSSPVRVLNFLQTMDNAFVIVGQQSGKVIIPAETLETLTPAAKTFSTSHQLRRQAIRGESSSAKASMNHPPTASLRWSMCSSQKQTLPKPRRQQLLRQEVCKTLLCNTVEICR